ncbi:MAG: hypothetical protein WDA24_01015 [Tissierellales bacterium]
MNSIKETEQNLADLSMLFISLFDKIKAEGIISQEEYDIHTLLKREFLHKIGSTHIS